MLHKASARGGGESIFVLTEERFHFTGVEQGNGTAVRVLRRHRGGGVGQ
jgi:hypothetical protein